MDTIGRLNKFLRDHDPYEYRDNEMDLDRVSELVATEPLNIIEYLLDVIEEMEE